MIKRLLAALLIAAPIAAQHIGKRHWIECDPRVPGLFVFGDARPGKGWIFANFRTKRQTVLGCDWRIDVPAFVVPVTPDKSAMAIWRIELPDDARLRGLKFYFQGVVRLGNTWKSTDAIELVIR